MKRFLKLTSLVLCIFASVTIFAFADNEAEGEIRPQIKISGFGETEALTDENYKTYSTAKAGNSVIISCPEGIDSVYILYDQPTENTWTLTDTGSGKSVTCGEELFLHQFEDLKEIFGSAPAEVKLEFAEGDILADIYAFHGEHPDWVQIWKPCLKEADLLLLTTHADDEQLFFAGLLPYYCMERKLDVQVVYFIQHFHKKHLVFNHDRQHELLNGLWHVGVRNYPYISEFPDSFGSGDTPEDAMKVLMNSFRYYGYKYDDFQKFAVEIMRRFKPLVVVTHDFKGEYGHPAHCLNANVTTKAITLAQDASKYPESAEKYDTWAPQKVYVHLYNKNPIVMDWDTPYESMDGKTPFQMTQEGFGFHKSQHGYWFYRWIYGRGSNHITKATEINTYSPCNYGLYYTSVGEDKAKNDMMENVYTYSQKRADKEAEEARRKAEEEARQEAERKAREEEEQRRREAEAAEKAARKEAEAQRRRTRNTVIFIAAALIIAVLILLCLRNAKKKNRLKE
ncbi:MAG: PIG-L family deacetylase [Firmicutes bacterium]|nr:PIG-L family deacetylase [Bacillota bacterium]